jgi:hypothetical protein
MRYFLVHWTDPRVERGTCSIPSLLFYRVYLHLLVKSHGFVQQVLILERLVHEARVRLGFSLNVLSGSVGMNALLARPC